MQTSDQFITWACNWPLQVEPPSNGRTPGSSSSLGRPLPQVLLLDWVLCCSCYIITRLLELEACLISHFLSSLLPFGLSWALLQFLTQRFGSGTANSPDIVIFKQLQHLRHTLSTSNSCLHPLAQCGDHRHPAAPLSSATQPLHTTHTFAHTISAHTSALKLSLSLRPTSISCRVAANSCPHRPIARRACPPSQPASRLHALLIQRACPSHA